jgi:hypothetical protein
VYRSFAFVKSFFVIYFGKQALCCLLFLNSLYRNFTEKRETQKQKEKNWGEKQEKKLRGR